MRKLETAVAVSLALTSSGVLALGLGEIEMNSALNQPMDAEIRLTSVKPGETDGMIVQLASTDAFARAGIDRSEVLTDLEFSVEQGGNGPYIRIKSDQPVIEPFLNFLLEVDWPQGRMVREYTVLLDPPVFMTPSATARNESADRPARLDREEPSLLTPTPIDRNDQTGVEVPLDGELAEISDEEILGSGSDGEVVSLDDLAADNASAGGEAVSLSDLSAPNSQAGSALQAQGVGGQVEVDDNLVVAGPDEVRRAPTADSEVVSLDALEEDSSGASDGRRDSVEVQPGDTLFEIAEAYPRPGVSVQQMMLALLSANESAFINGNINLVKAGATLEIPEANDASRLTQAEALAAINDQDQLWREYRDAVRASTSTRLAEADVSADAPADGGDSDADATAEPDAAADGVDATGISEDDLTEDARAILESARQEIARQDELRIVADGNSGSDEASATTDDNDADGSNQMAEITRRLQLAREEMASTDLQSGDLDDQVSELQSTSENLDALVALRQTEIARLESQLAEMRESSDSESSDGADTAASADSEGASSEPGSTANSDAAGSANVEDSDADASAGDTTTSDADADAGAEPDNALTAAGEELDSVELIDEDNTAAGDSDAGADTTESTSTASDANAPVARTWYQELLADPLRMAVAGVGGLMLLGLGVLLLRRRRGGDEERLDYDEEVEFIDDEEATSLMQDTRPAARNEAAAAAAAATAAGVAGAASTEHSTDEPDPTGENLDTVASAAPADSALDDSSVDASSDETLSEVDVYLAYGLHGQAEEMLSKAIEKDPGNQDYAAKLLQTYHAQGNSEGFHRTATDFHARFDGDNNPAWADIAALGRDLRPADPLYSSTAGAVESVGRGDFDAPKLSDEDFLGGSADEEATESISRKFGQSPDVSPESLADLAPAAVDGQESDLMDQSIDPAMAFDEGDLEATGDFSRIADELAQEDQDGSIDFPGFEDLPTADSAADDVAASPSDAEPLVETGSDDLNLDETLSGVEASEIPDADNPAMMSSSDHAGAAADLLDMDDPHDGTMEFDGEELSLDELDVASGNGAANDAGEALDLTPVADDLTLDLEQLSSDMELDGNELLGDNIGQIDGLDLPDLTADNELLGEGEGGADEMDTMMDLAKAYIDMGDKDSASSALDEIVKSGNPEQVSEAETLLRKIS